MTSPASRIRGRTPRTYTPWLVVFALVATLVMNALATTLPLAGRSTGEISDLYPVMITPAGFTFSIWGVIYIALSAFAIHQALLGRRRSSHLEPLRWCFVATCVFNIGWLVVWHNLFIVASMVFMVALLATLIWMYRLSRTRAAPRDAGYVGFVKVPVSLYLGWISVASVVNARVLAYELGWTGGGMPEKAATVAALALLALLALWILARQRDLAYAAVIIWAAYGIFAANRGEASVAFAAASAALLVVTGAIWTLVERGRSARA